MCIRGAACESGTTSALVVSGGLEPRVETSVAPLCCLHLGAECDAYIFGGQEAYLCALSIVSDCQRVNFVQGRRLYVRFLYCVETRNLGNCPFA